jgi:peptide methionine sulfoxide reductase msrA/msrB
MLRWALILLPLFAVGVAFAMRHQSAPQSAGSPATAPAATASPGAPPVTVQLFDDRGELTGPVSVPKVIKSDDEWLKLLTPEQYQIARAKGTERAFCGLYYDQHDPGVYVCVCCGLPLFSSEHKFESGTGWPSYFQPIAHENVVTHSDTSHFMVRTEILCARCDAHLGHVFDDGPPPTGQRHCLNSASLVFIPKDRLAFEPEKGHYRQTAEFAAGCFWGVEETFRTTPGVTATAVGYAGGKTDNPTYKEVCTDKTGHAEAVRVEYDPQVVGYEQLLDIFWQNHDPTQLNRQGPDTGTQYRSAIFYRGEAQRATAEASKERLQKSGRYARPIVTEIVPDKGFWMAEDYHQQYLKKRGLSSCEVK